MANILEKMPELEGEEITFVKSLTEGMTDEQLEQFVISYKSKRKDPTMVLILTILLGGLGVHRFILGDVGMGILYLFTGGLCWIGIIIDLINYKKITLEANQKIAQETVLIIKR